MKNLIQLLRDNTKAPGLIRAQIEGDRADIVLKGVISADWGVSAMDLRTAFVQAEGRDVALRINSPGGDVFEGREMQSVIAGYSGKVTAIVEGIAASAATIVCMAANETHMVKGTRYMIHNGWTIGIGNRHDFAALHAMLTSFDTELASEYATYSGQTALQTAEWMDAETWFTSAQALESGFVQKLVENTKADHVTNQLKGWNLSAYKNAPDLSGESPPEPPPPDYAALRAANERRLRLLQID